MEIDIFKNLQEKNPLAWVLVVTSYYVLLHVITSFHVSRIFKVLSRAIHGVAFLRGLLVTAVCRGLFVCQGGFVQVVHDCDFWEFYDE